MNLVLLLIDWDNLFFSLYERFGADEMHLESRIKNMIKWVNVEIGGLLGGYGFVFAPEHLAFHFQQICVKNNLKLMICPKRQLAEPKRNQKTGEMITEEDTVDETIEWFARTMFYHSQFKYICLVSGDNDFVPLLQEAIKYGIRRAIIPPTIDCLSKSKELVDLADRNPLTLKRMILRLDTV
ncbi:MAG: NYN domain-containing protein [Candidatus Staskawiczbacteria bacterium]|nr:NYN domain-containing protein [Candidatus Staskawiczbacteria bacterium]